MSLTKTRDQQRCHYQSHNSNIIHYFIIETFLKKDSPRASTDPYRLRDTCLTQNRIKSVSLRDKLSTRLRFNSKTYLVIIFV